MVRLRRRFITMIEMLIAIALLAIVGGIVAININRFVNEQRFNSETSIVVDSLRLAQDLMLVLQTDVKLFFEPDKDKTSISYWIEVEKPPSEAWLKELTRPRKPLKAIRNIDFKDNYGVSRSDLAKLELYFLSGGSVMSSGVLTLSNDEPNSTDPNVLKRYICLQGYPSPINSASSENALLCDNKAEQSYIDKITQQTIREITDKEQANALQQKK